MGSLVIKKRNNQRKMEDSRRVRDTKVIKSKDAKDDVNEVLAKLSKEDVEALIELIPFKEALIKIAKGEFEIERIIEEDEDDEDLDTEDLDGDDDGEVVGEDDEDDSNDNLEVDENLETGDEDDYEDFEEDSDVVEDSNAINEAWKKRLNGSKDL